MPPWTGASLRTVGAGSWTTSSLPRPAPTPGPSSPSRPRSTAPSSNATPGWPPRSTADLSAVHSISPSGRGGSSWIPTKIPYRLCRLAMLPQQVWFNVLIRRGNRGYYAFRLVEQDSQRGGRVLKLKKLQILGFKSFCDRTELQFSGTGVVAIVGPNGCGKSNIADAISWVLGEQSAKSLRGGRMEDVIFAGTRDRMATGMAEVSLTLIDPAEYEPGPEPAAEEIEPAGTESWDDADSALNGSTTPEASAAAGTGVVLTFRKRRKVQPHNRRGEIVVTRRLFRNGESDYLMNGRPCRLRDIQELFMGTGLGPESYAIIEQGRIGQILSSKPYDRRAMIEEAAGVSKYKAKRRQAEARLEAAKLNLSRINDIFEEVTRQVASLKRQAAKAERYRQYKTELDTQQRQWMRRRAAAQVEAATALERERAELQAAVTAARLAVEE